MKMLKFPPEIQQHFPSNTLSVHKFIALNLPSCAPAATTRLARANSYVSGLQQTVDNVNETILLLSPSDDILTTIQQSMRSGIVKSILCPHSPTANSQRYPLWLASFWFQLSAIRKIQKKWFMAIRNLELRMNQDPESIPLRQAFNALSHILWTGQLQGFHDTIELEKLSTYFTQEWLSDDHELVMLSSLKQDIHAVGRGDSFIENTAFMLLLGNAYQDQVDQQTYMTERCYEWLRDRGNELAMGEKRYLSTIANQDGVHWVAIILDFDQRKILYGDPYGNRISAEHHTIINWWTEHHTGIHFTLHDLPIRRQVDNFSCGILSWNSLRLHYGLVSEFESLMDPFECRAEVFLHLTDYYHKDKVSSNI